MAQAQVGGISPRLRKAEKKKGPRILMCGVPWTAFLLGDETWEVYWMQFLFPVPADCDKVVLMKEGGLLVNKYFLGALVVLTGCSSSVVETSRSVLKGYETVVFEDGISLEEAKIIAQKGLIKANEVRIYDLAAPQVAGDVSDLPRYQDYWFIFFKERTVVNIEYTFMVAVDKKSGDIQYAGDYPVGNRWILEAALLHR